MVRRLSTLDLLMVDDDPGDLRIAQEAIKEAQLPIRLHTARDGDEALAFLRKQGKHSSAIRPHLVLMDVNMPRKNGLETLKELKADDNLRDIPVIVLTTSDAPADIRNAYRMHANCYVAKPVDLDKFVSVLRDVGTFWSGVAKVPTEG